MRKGRALLGVVSILLAVAVSPRAPRAGAQAAAPPASCAGSVASTPMQGRYTGTWRSTGDYHFTTLGHDIDLQVSIEGTLDVTVDAGGQVSGTVRGTVDAPVMHDGQRDVSSGTGTISGQIGGALGANAAGLILAQPVIFMHWGTFAGSGYTADRYITMPDYQFPLSGSDCVDASGAIAEQNFPVQNIVDDFNGQISQVPGVGSASGTWSLVSDSASRFAQLSQQVDAFISQANSLLNNRAANLTPAAVAAQVTSPLQQLESTIRQDPTVARCLLDRLDAWEAAAVTGLLHGAAGETISDVTALRRAGDLLRSARQLNLDCNVPEGDLPSSLAAAARTMLDGAVARNAWPDVMLVSRELLLLDGEGGRAPLQQRLNSDLHLALSTGSDNQGLLAVLRVAYALGDDEDAAVAFARLTPEQALIGRRSTSMWRRGATHHPPKHRARPRRKKGKSKRRPAPTPTPTATSTPVPPRKTLEQVLMSGLLPLTATSVNGSSPGLAWQPVKGASSYLVTVTASTTPRILWTWSGGATGVTFGDTAIDGLSGSNADGWTISPTSGYQWSVLALDGQGRIISAMFRAQK